MRLIVFSTLFVVCCCKLALSDEQSDVVSQPLEYAGNYLVTSVGIGEPPQYFDLAIDLNSDKLFVLDRSTVNVDIDYGYDYIKNLYLPEASETVNMTSNYCKERYKINYNIQTADGVYANDLITLGGEEFQRLVHFCDITTSRNVTSIYNDPLNWLFTLPFDGFIGLKPGGENIYERMTAGIHQITLYIDNTSLLPGSEPDNAGVITFNGKDDAHCKNYKTFPSADSDKFSTWISKVSFNSNDYKGYYSAAFSTKNDTFIVPTAIYNAINSYFGSDITDFYCDSYSNPPDLKVTIYGIEYKIDIKSMIQKTSTSYCKVDIGYGSSGDENDFVFGRAILSSYCLFLDYDEALIALADKK
ncbi:Pepsin F-like [Aphelenchoides besseyi]|nr:Pepsin F-like [Aphelenchoides besseyi]